MHAITTPGTDHTILSLKPELIGKLNVWWHVGCVVQMVIRYDAAVRAGDLSSPAVLRQFQQEFPLTRQALVQIDGTVNALAEKSTVSWCPG